MTRDPRDTSAEEPDGGNLHVRFRRGPGSGNRPGLLNKRKQRSRVPAKVKAVRTRIERWRRTRKKRSRMPEDLWAAAVALARVHGVYRAAQMLTVSYETLKRRTADSAKTRRAGKRGSAPAGFVELDAGQLMVSTDPTATVVELTDGDGAKLVIRVPGPGHVDLLGLANGFWRRER